MMLYNLGFLIHIIIEIPASINFFCFPSRQLGIHTPQAHAVIRQYAVLLLVSVLLATVFVARPLDNTAGKVAGALALYHIAPFVRSAVRLHRQTQARAPIIYSEAFLYVFVHSICFAALLHHCWTALYQKDRRNDRSWIGTWRTALEYHHLDSYAGTERTPDYMISGFTLQKPIHNTEYGGT